MLQEDERESPQRPLGTPLFVRPCRVKNLDYLQSLKNRPSIMPNHLYSRKEDGVFYNPVVTNTRQIQRGRQIYKKLRVRPSILHKRSSHILNLQGGKRQWSVRWSVRGFIRGSVQGAVRTISLGPKLIISNKTHYVNSQKQWINNKYKLDFHTWELINPLDAGDFLALSEFLPENKDPFEMFKYWMGGCGQSWPRLTIETPLSVPLWIRSFTHYSCLNMLTIPK